MCEPVTLGLLAASTALGAYGQIQQGQYANDVGKYNQRMAEYSAADAERRGQDEANRLRRDARALKDKQRATFAGGGVDVGYGTAMDLQDQTDFFGEADAQTAIYNSKLDAWSARTGGQMARAEGRMAKQQGYLGAAATLLGGASKVASKWPTKKTT